MSRRVILIDRIAAVLIGLLFVAAGAGLVLWWTRVFPRVPDTIDAAAVARVLDQPWWPWALGAGAVVVLLLGVRWLTAHVPRRGTDRLRLDGSGSAGRLSASSDKVASAAAEVLGQAPGVRSASGTVLRERGQVVARLTATVEPTADLSLVAASADEVAAGLRQVLGRDDVRCTVQLKLARRGRDLPRVI